MNTPHFDPDHYQYQAFVRGLTKLYRSTGLRPMVNRSSYLVVTNRTNRDLPYECPFPKWDGREREYITNEALTQRERVRVIQAKEAKDRALYEELKTRFGNEED